MQIQNIAKRRWGNWKQSSDRFRTRQARQAAAKGKESRVGTGIAVLEQREHKQAEMG